MPKIVKIGKFEKKILNLNFQFSAYMKLHMVTTRLSKIIIELNIIPPHHQVAELMIIITQPLLVQLQPWLTPLQPLQPHILQHNISAVWWEQAQVLLASFNPLQVSSVEKSQNYLESFITILDLCISCAIFKILRIYPWMPLIINY